MYQTPLKEKRTAFVLSLQNLVDPTATAAWKQKKKPRSRLLKPLINSIHTTKDHPLECRPQPLRRLAGGYLSLTEICGLLSRPHHSLRQHGANPFSSTTSLEASSLSASPVYSSPSGTCFHTLRS